MKKIKIDQNFLDNNRGLSKDLKLKIGDTLDVSVNKSAELKGDPIPSDPIKPKP